MKFKGELRNYKIKNKDMLQLIFVGVLTSIIVEIIKKNKKTDKVFTILNIIIFSTVFAAMSVWILDYKFFPSLGWIMIFAGAFYSYVLRNVKGK